MSNLGLPSHFLSEKQLDHLIENMLEVVVPYSFDTGDENYTHALVWVDGSDMGGTYFDPSQKVWRDSKIRSLDHPVNTDWNSHWVGDVIFLSEDVQKVKDIHQWISQNANGFYPEKVVPDEDIKVSDMTGFDGSESCTCVDIASDSVMPGPKDLSELDHQLILCKDCLELYGLFVDGKRYDLSAVFDEEWVFEESPDDIIEIGRDNSYLLYSSGSSISRTERSIDAMQHIGSLESAVFSNYDPSEHESLVLIRNGESAGYLSWGMWDDAPIVRQVFVRKPHRGNGVAKTLIEGWRKEYLDSDLYYLDDPNEYGQALFESVGDLSGEGDTQAVRWHDIHPVQSHVDAGPFWQDLSMTYGLMPLS